MAPAVAGDGSTVDTRHEAAALRAYARQSKNKSLDLGSPDGFSQPPTMLAEWASGRESGREPS